MKLVYSIKALALTIGLVLAVSFVNGATYYGKTGLSPHLTNSWGTAPGGIGTAPGGAFTVAGNIFIIESGVTMTATAVWPVGLATNPGTASTLQINSGGSLNMSTFLLTLASCNFTNAGTYSGSGGVTISGTNGTISIAGFTTTGTVSMTKTAGTATFTGNVNGVGLLMSGLGGTLNLGTGLTHTFSGTWTRTNGTLNGGSSTINFTKLTPVFSGTTGSFTAGAGTVGFTGAGIQTLPVLTYNNITLEGSGAKTFSGGTSTINGILSLGGTATVTYTSTPTMSATSILQYNKPALFTAGAEWQLPLAGGIKIMNAGAITSPSSTMSVASLAIDAGAQLTVLRSLTVSGATNISGKVIWSSTSTNSRTMRFTGNVILNDGATWTEPATGNGAINTYNFAGNFENNATTFTGVGTGIHTFSGTAKTISGSTNTSIPNITISGTISNSGIITGTTSLIVSGTVTNTGTITATTSLSGGGTLTQGTDGNLNIAGTISITALSASANVNTVSYTGAAQTVKPVTYYHLTLSGSAAKTLTGISTINGNLTLSGTATATSAAALTVGGDLTVGAGTSFTTGATNTYTLTVTGATSVSGTLTLANTAGKSFGGLVTIGGTLNETGVAAITFMGGIDNTGTFTPNTGIHSFTTNSQSLTGVPSLANITIDLNGAVLTCNGDLTCSGNFITTSGSTLDMLANALSVTTISHAGILRTEKAASAFTSGKSWGGTIEYAGSSAITAVVGTTYTNLTISNTAGVLASDNFLVSGVLNLSVNNPSSTSGSLAMGSYTLTMGSAATTIGVGDVTGIVKRTSFELGTDYTFGSEFTILNFSGAPLVSTEISIKIVLTNTHTWFPNAIHRYYDIIQTGGTSSTIVNITLHYLDDELNGAVEGNLDIYDYHAGGSTHDHGHSNANITNNWIALFGKTLTYTAPSSNFNVKYWTIGPSSQISEVTWLGAEDADWNNTANWSGGVVPTSVTNVIIPDASDPDNLFDPTLPTTTINSITILTGGILNGGSGILTLEGTDAWTNYGTFDAGSSTVIFTNPLATYADPTYFNNITIATGAKLSLGTDSYFGISGSITIEGTGVLDAASNHCTVEYNGISEQTVINPNASVPGYHNLILNNVGSLILPSTKLYIRGDLTNNNSAAIFNNVEFNGPYTMQQNIVGTATFNTLTINSTNGVTSANDLTINTNLLLNNGILTASGSKVIIAGTGSVSRLSGWVNGILEKTLTTNSTDYLFETGTTVYAPATINMTGMASTVTLDASVTSGTPSSPSGLNPAAICDHYWTINQTDANAFGTYSATFDFTNTTNSGNTAAYVVKKGNNPLWDLVTSSITGTTITATELDGFSEFALGEAGSLTVATQPSAYTVCLFDGSIATFSATSNSIPAPGIQWQRYDGTSWNDITYSGLDIGIDITYAGYNSETLSIILGGASSASNGFQYRALFSNVNGTVFSNEAVLTVIPSSVGGTIGMSGTTVCYGGTKLLTLNGNTGNIIYWQSSTDQGDTWTDIASTSNPFTTNSIIIPTVYRAWVQSGECSVATSSTSAEITISGDNTWQGSTTGDWEVAANWCGGVPIFSSDIVIPASTTVHITSAPGSPAVCNNLTITATGALIIDAGKAFTINGTLTNSGTITIKSDVTGTGSLIHNTAGIAGTVERYIAGWSDANHGWHFLSSPVAAQAIDDFHNISSGNDFYKWDEITNYWINRKAGGFETEFAVGTGYLIANETTAIPAFTGNLNVGDVPVTGLTMTGSQEYTGWHLIGNPYSSALSWNNGDWSLNQISANCEIWDEASASYTPAVIAPDEAIPAMNGFMVHADAADASLTIPASARVHNIQAWYKSAEQNSDMIVLIARDPVGKTAQRSVIRFADDATEGYDTQYDNYFLSGFAPLFYSVSQDLNYILNTLPETGKTATIPMGFVKNSSTQFSIELAKTIPGLPVYLTDQKINQTRNLNDGSYAFTSEVGDKADRFLLSFMEATAIADPQKAKDFTMFVSDGILNIQSLNQLGGKVLVSDMLGRTLATGSVEAGATAHINIQGKAGVYIVSVLTSKGRSNTKIIVK
jgi:hypothetical protein